MEPRPYGCSRKAILVTLGLILMVSLCGGVSMLAVDGLCARSLTQRLPIYPNATVKFQRHNFLRPFGMGTTVMIMHSDDSVEIVRDWYGRTVAAAAIAAGNDPFYYIPVGRYSVAHEEDGKGTQIILSGDCIS